MAHREAMASKNSVPEVVPMTNQRILRMIGCPLVIMPVPVVGGLLMYMIRSRVLLASCLLAALACPTPARADVLSYVKMPDKEFRWEQKKKLDQVDGTVYDLEMVSQVW